jgi:alpha-beta hydrolase superfamily lysophospholipase
MMQKETAIVKGVKNQNLFVRRYGDEKAKNGVIQILHGMSEYGGNYEDFAGFLVNNGYIVYVHDHRKHGESLSKGQKIGYFTDDTWEDMVEDVERVQRYIVERENTQTLILFGHSMGSFLCRNYLINYGDRISKAVIMGTADADVMTSKFGGLVAKIYEKTAGDKTNAFLHYMSIGRLSNKKDPTRKENDWLSRDLEAVERYNNDEGCGFSYTPRFYGEIAKAVLFIFNKKNIAKTQKIPLYFISGEADEIGKCGKGVKRVADIYKALGYDVTLDLIEGAKHAILDETNKEEVYDKILTFLES